MIRVLIIFLTFLASFPAFAQNAADEGLTHREPPVFPGGYWQYGIVAHCTVIYSTNDRGRTRDICSACNTNMDPEHYRSSRIQREFESSARDAVNRWRYEPGDARTGLVNTIIFSTDDIEGALLAQPDVPACRHYPNS